MNEEKEYYVFVYGTLLTGERNERWAAGAKHTPATAYGTLYDTHCGYPALVQEGSTLIKGEILLTDEAGLKQMDRLEGYPNFYRRETIEATLTLTGEKIAALAYIMNRLPQDASVISNGDWRHREMGVK